MSAATATGFALGGLLMSVTGADGRDRAREQQDQAGAAEQENQADGGRSVTRPGPGGERRTDQHA